MRVQNGKITDTLVGGLSGGPANLSQHVSVLIGPLAANTKVSLSLGDYGMSQTFPDESSRRSFGSVSLARHLKAGDYVLGGAYRIQDNHTVLSSSVADLLEGYVLRITSGISSH